MIKKILILIPILNEKDNILMLLEKIKNLNIETSILYIDDNSLDGSRDILNKLKDEKQNIYLIERNRRLGIGSAHKEGIKWAYVNNYDFLITIDGDGTHDPVFIKEIIIKLEKFDIVNTSRFLEKNTLKNWSIYRIFLTKLRYILTNFFLGSNLDSSSGFRGYNLKKLKETDLLFSKNDDYFFLIESLTFLEKKKYNVTEISHNLDNRNTGVSKMQFKHLWQSLISLIKLSVKLRLSKKNLFIDG